MKTLYQKLQEYFDKTPIETIKEDWDKTEKFDGINSPPIDEFILESKVLIDVGEFDPHLYQKSFVNKIKNPNFSSDFFLH